MAKFEALTVLNFPQLEAKLTNLKGIARFAAINVIAETAFAIQAKAKQKINVDRGQTRASLITAFTPDRLTAEVGSNLPNARWLEEGTDPHFPPIDAILAWVHRKGFAASSGGRLSRKENEFLVALSIARKIAAVGTKEHPYLLPAAEEESDKYFERMARTLNASIDSIREG